MLGFLFDPVLLGRRDSKQLALDRIMTKPITIEREFLIHRSRSKFNRVCNNHVVYSSRQENVLVMHHVRGIEAMKLLTKVKLHTSFVTMANENDCYR